MWTLPMASFLAGSLLSLILPVGLLIAIVIWYVISIRRTPDRPDSGEVRAIAASAETRAASPAPPQSGE